MNTPEKTIVVVGATGRQGSSAIRRLLSSGWRIRALTRDAKTPVAQTLKLAGAEVIQGDTNDRSSLDAAMRGAYGVLCIQPALAYADELRQGTNVADAASVAGVQHFVYMSVGGAEGQSAYRKIAKWEIEKHTQALGLPVTILRPAGFMDDMVGPRFGVPGGTFTIAIEPDKPLPLIAVTDIGVFIDLAFAQPGHFIGKTLELAGSVLFPPQVAEQLSQALGRSIPYVQIPMEALRQHNVEVARVFAFYNETGYQVDIAALRALHPGLMDFETWLKREGTAKYEAVSH